MTVWTPRTCLLRRARYGHPKCTYPARRAEAQAYCPWWLGVRRRAASDGSGWRIRRRDAARSVRVGHVVDGRRYGHVPVRHGDRGPRAPHFARARIGQDDVRAVSSQLGAPVRLGGSWLAPPRPRGEATAVTVGEGGHGDEGAASLARGGRSRRRRPSARRMGWSPSLTRTRSCASSSEAPRAVRTEPPARVVVRDCTTAG